MIPVYVNVFNRLTTTRTLCEQIARLDNAVPIIIDNASTWGPLLDWYSECDYEVIKLRDNLGHHSPWRCGAVRSDGSPLYCVTDCDLDLNEVPKDLLSVLEYSLDHNRVIKSGVGLRIDDVPKSQTSVISWEKRFWKKPTVDNRFFWAPIDTTFAMYSSRTPDSVATQVIVKATRTNVPYVARHMPWYLDLTNLDDENKNYFRTANSSNSWKPDGSKLHSSFQEVVK